MEQPETIMTKKNLLLRTAIESDLPTLAKLFDDSVRQIAPQKYSPEQVDAWAVSAMDTNFFSRLEYARTNQCDRLYTEASEFSKPLFKKFGFEIYGEEKVIRNKIQFQRYLMQKFIP